MHFDALCLAAITDETAPLLVGGRVQQLLLAGPHALALELYTAGERRYLLLQAAPADLRVHLVRDKVRRGVEGETPLLLLLRKYVRDAILTGVVQPDPSERLLVLSFRHKQHGETRLQVELLGRAANLVLTRGNGMVLDCLHRLSGEAGGRVLLPGRPYTPPLPPTRASPLLPAPELAAALAPLLEARGSVAKAITAQVAGVGPEQAREIVRRALAADGLPAGAEAELRTPAGLQLLAAAIGALWAPVHSGAWQPQLWLAEGRAVAYSPWQPMPGAGAPDSTPRPTLSQAIEDVAAAVAASAASAGSAVSPSPVAETAQGDAYAAQRAEIAQQLRAARARLSRALAALAGDEPAPGAAEQLRSEAEWLLALHTTLPPGATHLLLSPEESGGPAIHLALDPTRSPVAQAQAAFKRAGKLERAAVFVPQRRSRLQTDLAFLDDLEADLAQAQNQPEIAAVRATLEAAGLAARRGAPQQTPRARAPAVAGPHRFVADDGCVILVGRNARQNDALTFETAAAADLWLHVRGAPGAHVVILGHGRTPAPATIEQAARLAGAHSSLRGERAVDVIVAERRHVNRLPGGHPGQVTVRKERVVRVELDAIEKREARIEKG